jgi:hypothetical protein
VFAGCGEAFSNAHAGPGLADRRVEITGPTDRKMVSPQPADEWHLIDRIGHQRFEQASIWHH